MSPTTWVQIPQCAENLCSHFAILHGLEHESWPTQRVSVPTQAPPYCCSLSILFLSKSASGYLAIEEVWSLHPSRSMFWSQGPIFAHNVTHVVACGVNRVYSYCIAFFRLGSGSFFHWIVKTTEKTWTSNKTFPSLIPQTGVKFHFLCYCGSFQSKITPYYTFILSFVLVFSDMWFNTLIANLYNKYCCTLFYDGKCQNTLVNSYINMIVILP